MAKKKRVMIFIVVGIIVVVLVFFLNYMIRVNNYQKDVSSMTFSNIDISKIADGTYIGECNVDFIYAKVEVTVMDGAMTKIDLLEHKNEKGASAEIITDDIIQHQQIDVDAISGATNSSKVIKMAVENALSTK